MGIKDLNTYSQTMFTESVTVIAMTAYRAAMGLSKQKFQKHENRFIMREIIKNIVLNNLWVCVLNKSE